MIKYLYSNEHMSFMALAPLTIVNYLPMNIWTGLVIIIFYLGICTLPVYLNRYFLPKYFKSKYCLILAIIITVSILLFSHSLVFVWLVIILYVVLERGRGNIIDLSSEMEKKTAKSGNTMNRPQFNGHFKKYTEKWDKEKRGRLYLIEQHSPCNIFRNKYLLINNYKVQWRSWCF